MERCSFFNAELNGDTYDRVYLAEDFARYFSSFIGNGVFPNPATGLQVVADNNSMNVAIRKGKAWINGYFYENTDDLVLQVNVPHGVLNRIDRVVLRLDFLNREIKVYIKQGDFASFPVAPTLTRNADIYELALAEITINKGIIKIDQALITDLRFNKELCGFVKGTIEEIDTTGLFTKFEQGFEAWFEYMKGTIEGDAAANLTTKVYEVNTKLDTKATKDGTLQTNLNSEKVGGILANELALKTELNNTNNEIKKINNSIGVPLGFATLDDKGKVSTSQLNVGFDILANNLKDVTLNNLNLKKYSHLEIGFTVYRTVLLKLNGKTIATFRGSNSSDGFLACLSSNGVFYYHDHNDNGTIHSLSTSANVLDNNNTLTLMGDLNEDFYDRGFADKICIIGVK